MKKARLVACLGNEVKFHIIKINELIKELEANSEIKTQINELKRLRSEFEKSYEEINRLPI